MNVHFYLNVPLVTYEYYEFDSDRQFVVALFMLLERLNLHFAVTLFPRVVRGLN